MTKRNVQTIAATHVIDTADYMAALPESMQKALTRSNSAFAGVLPEILVDILGGILVSRVEVLDNGSVAIVNYNGTRFKVVASSSNRFNLLPSYTKGYGRDGFGIDAKQSLINRFDYVILVNIKNRNELQAARIRVREIETNTIVLK